MTHGCRIILILGLGCTISACALFHTTQEDDRVAVCKQLKKQIIWNSANGSQQLWNNGATGNQMLPMEQRADTDLLNKNYRQEGCS